MHERGQKSVQGFGGKAQRDCLEDEREDGIRMDLGENGWGECRVDLVGSG
jgi:hypothetical protein